MRVGDTWPSLRMQFFGKKKGLALGLADATGVVFAAKHRLTGTEIGGACTIIQAGDDETGTDIGVVEYEWQAGDTDLAGLYDFWFVVTWTGGAVGTIPANDPAFVFLVAAAP